MTLDEVEGLLEDQTMGERFIRKYATYTEEVAERGLQQGLARGRDEGRNEGRNEGREEGLEAGRRKLREILKRQIAKRFGNIPAAMTTRIDAASEDELARWSERIVDAGRQEDLFAD